MKNLSLVIYMKENNINWSEFSSNYSLKGLKEGLKVTRDLEQLGAWVHNYWIKAVIDLWFLIDNGVMVEGGYTKEKKESHKLMMVSYKELSRENQLKDIYTVKNLVTPMMWGLLNGYEYEQEFKNYNIGW